VRVATRVAVGAVVGAIGLSFALALVSSWIGGEALEAAYVVGMLIGMPAFLLLIPVLIVAAGVERSVNRAHRGTPIAASWDILLDGEVHVVSLPASRIAAPDHAWVDGVRIPLEWAPTGAWTAGAMLDGGTFSGTLRKGYDPGEVAATVGFSAASAALGASVASVPAARYALRIEGATATAVPVVDGERRA
jgi:hypothetical protein